MALGPGKFDDLATLVREQASALGVIVVVIDAPAGSGFSIQATPEVTARLPELLRYLADEIERDLSG
jgi:hypothetical protein